MENSQSCESQAKDSRRKRQGAGAVLSEDGKELKHVFKPHVFFSPLPFHSL